MKDEILKSDKILDFYDQVQLFTGRDKFDAQYLCLLYDDTPSPRYTAVKVSTERLGQFLDGKVDLREIFIAPENEGEFFDVTSKDGEYILIPLRVDKLSEERLPLSGYTINPDTKESVTVNLPVKDHMLLMELVRKFGWAYML